MGQLQELKSQLDGLGFEIIAIAPDPPEKLAEVRDRVGLDFALLSDVDFEAAKAYGVAFMNNRKRSIAIDDILRAMKIGFETRPCALEERENLSSPFEDPLLPWATAVFAT